MATEYPPLNKIHVVGYSANDNNFPILNLIADPRVAGYKVPEDLSACPDKRYPNHVFTGAQPISGDQRVRHVWEILPSPWVPFTRYDDDLGPIQGRRRFVKNEGQEASLTSSTKTSYEAREGSALVSSEIEETWSIKVDEDGNSLFPIKDRDFYDASRGPVQERRQLFVPTGEEAGSLENVDGVITQTSYEPYNEFLSVKIVQTYKVDGPQLVGRSTDNDGQLVTVTSQRKGARDYVPPDPTATRTVEVNREDAESLIERIIDTPEVFKANTFSLERPDPIPQKFRVAVPLESSQEIVEGTAEMPALANGEISRTEEQRNKFIKRVSATSRDQTVLPQTLVSKSTDNDRQEVTITETLQTGDTEESPTATTTVESDALGDGNYVVRKTEIPEVFSALTLSKERPDPVPQKFRVSIPLSTRQETLAGVAQDPVLTSGEIANSEQQVNKFVKRVSSTTRDAAQLPKSLTQKTTTNEGLLATVTETLQSGDTSTIPSAKKTVESEALGDGTYVVRVTEAPEVFSAKTFRAEKADLTPQKFRAKQSDLTTEENIEGTAAAPTLGANQFLKSEQQINKFVKRVTTTTRETELNETLNESVITPEGQQAKRTITLTKAGQTLVPSATLIDGSVEELGDGRTVKTEISVTDVFDGKQITIEKPEVIPPEFRGSTPNTTVVETAASTKAEINDLEENEVAKSVQRITTHKIRTSTTTRPIERYPQLKETLIDNDLIEIDRVKTLAKENQTIEPSAFISGTVIAIGDGYTLKTEDKKKKLFDGKTISNQQSIRIPDKFLNETIEETAINLENDNKTIATPKLGNDGFGVIQSSIQKINEFVVRTTERKVSGQTGLEESQTNNFGQKITVTSTISDDPAIEVNALTEFARAQSIGGGKYVKEVGLVDDVFPEEQITERQNVAIPSKFIVSQSTISRVEEGNEADADNIGRGGSGVIESSAQRITEHKVRKTTTRQSIKSDLNGKIWTTELNGGIADVVETVGGSIAPAFGVISAEQEQVGDTTITRQITLVPQDLSGQDFDDFVMVGVPFTQSVVGAGTSGTPDSEITPRDSIHSIQKQYNFEQIKEKYLNTIFEIPDVVNISLPDFLTGVDVNIFEVKGGQNATATGNSSQATASATASYEVGVGFSVRNGYSGPAQARRKIFFIEGNGSIYSVLGDVRPFPVFQTETNSFSVVIQSESVSATASVSLPENKSQSISVQKQTDVRVYNVPATLHQAIGFGQYNKNFENKTKARASGPQSGVAEVEAVAKASVSFVGQINATDPNNFQAGNYLYSLNAQLYKYGLIKVEATYVDVTPNMVG